MNQKKRHLYPVVLCFHGCTTNRDEVDRFVAHVDDIKAQILELRKMGYQFVHPREYIKWYREEKEFPRPIACIHYDDGRDSIQLMMQWHIDNNIPCGLAIITRRLRSWEPEGGYVRWSWLREWVNSGVVELMSHTHDIHHVGLTGWQGDDVWSSPVLEGPCWVDEGDYVFIKEGDERWYWDKSHTEAAFSLPFLGTDQYDGVTPITTTMTVTPKFTGEIRFIRLWVSLTAPSGHGYNAQLQIRANGALVYDRTVEPVDYEFHSQWVELEYVTFEMDTPFGITQGVPLTLEFKTLNAGNSLLNVACIPTENDTQFYCVTTARGNTRAGSQPDPQRWWRYQSYPANDRWPVIPIMILATGDGRRATNEEFKEYISKDIQANIQAFKYNLYTTWQQVDLWAGTWEDVGTPEGYQLVGWDYPNNVDAIFRISSPYMNVTLEALKFSFDDLYPIDIPWQEWDDKWDEVQERDYFPIFRVSIADSENGPWTELATYAVWDAWWGQPAEIPPTYMARGQTKYIKLAPINKGPTIDVPERHTVYMIRAVTGAHRVYDRVAQTPTTICYPFGAYMPNWYEEDEPPYLPNWKDVSNALRDVFAENGFEIGFTIQAIRNVPHEYFTGWTMRQSDFTQGRLMLLGITPLEDTLNLIRAYGGTWLPDTQHKGKRWQVSLEGDVEGHGTVRHRPEAINYFAFDAWAFNGEGYKANADIVRDVNPMNTGMTLWGNTYADEKTWLQERGVHCSVIINNNLGTGQPNAEIASDIVHNPDAYIAKIVQYTLEEGWDSATVNIEAAPANEREYVTEFYRRLGRAMHDAGLELHITAPAATGTSYDAHWWTGWCDHAAIIPHVDAMKIMSYTETNDSTQPGPAAPQWFWDAVYDYMEAIIPPEFRGRILCGGRAFGHIWYSRTPNSNGYMSYAECINNAAQRGVPLTVGDTEIHFYYEDRFGHTVQSWCGSPLTLARSQDTAVEQGFGGVGIWKIDDGDVEEAYPKVRQIGQSKPLQVVIPRDMDEGTARGLVILTYNRMQFWEVPHDWNNDDNTIEVWAGGGGGSCAAYGREGGAGGGAGGYSRVDNVTLTPGELIPVSVGQNGWGVWYGGDGRDGGITVFGGTDLSDCIVGAENGRVSVDGIVPGEGGKAINGVGTIRYSGGDGGAGVAYGGGAGGGGAGSPDGDGQDGVDATTGEFAHGSPGGNSGTRQGGVGGTLETTADDLRGENDVEGGGGGGGGYAAGYGEPGGSPGAGGGGSGTVDGAYGGGDGGGGQIRIRYNPL